jgi:hypothetical protein
VISKFRFKKPLTAEIAEVSQRELDRKAQVDVGNSRFFVAALLRMTSLSTFRNDRPQFELRTGHLLST